MSRTGWRRKRCSVATWSNVRKRSSRLAPSMAIASTAVVAFAAQIPESCSIGPYCVIGAEVELGEHCRIDAHVVIEGPTRLGSHNHVFPFTTVGLPPQDISYAGEPTRLEIGDRNVIREFCSLHRGTRKGGTVITQDVLPFSKTSERREASAFGVNGIGLERRGFAPERIAALQRAFRVLHKSGLNTSQALEQIKGMPQTEDLAALIAFIESSERGVIK